MSPLSRDVLDALASLAASEVDVRALYVFGSRVKGEVQESSDLDVGVLYDRPSSLERTLALEETLDRALPMKVDLVDVGRAGAFVALDVVRGERVFCRDPDETDRFELYVLRRAGDLLPFERERRRLMLEPPR